MSNPVINEFGTLCWFNEQGQHHREDGPAVIRKNGDQEWFMHGDHHREDGPAVECANGTKCWYQQGQRHRMDGPAVIWSSGNKEWWIRDVEYTDIHKYCEAVGITGSHKTLLLLKYSGRL